MFDGCERSVITSVHEPANTGKRRRDPSRVELLQFQPGTGYVNAHRILRIQGYSNPVSVRPAIARAAELMASRAMELCRAQLATRQLGIEGLDASGVDLEDGHRLNCAAFENRLRDCDEVVGFVLTCGSSLDQAIVDFADSGDLLEAVLLESAGWLCLEDATRQFKQVIAQRAAARGKRITSRMGPGYSYAVHNSHVDWPLEDQPHLFELFGGVELPVTLMSSFAMNPKLSRSGLYGIAPLHDSRAGRPRPLN